MLIWAEARALLVLLSAQLAAFAQVCQYGCTCLGTFCKTKIDVIECANIKTHFFSSYPLMQWFPLVVKAPIMRVGETLKGVVLHF